MLGHDMARLGCGKGGSIGCGLECGWLMMDGVFVCLL